MNATWMTASLATNIWHGVRRLWRSPGLAAVNVTTLALSIGAATAIFSVVNGVLIKPLAYPDADRLVAVSHAAPGLNATDLGSAPFLYFTEREETATMEGVGLWELGWAVVTGIGEPERVRRLLVTQDVLPLLGIQPALGRFFTPEEDIPDSTPTVILTDQYWARHFGRNPSVLGGSLTMDGQPRVVVGVMPASFRFLALDVDVIYPFRINPSQARAGVYNWAGIGRLKPGVTLEQANADIDRVIPMAIERFPLRPGISREEVEKSGLRGNLQPLKSQVVGDVGNTLWVLMATVGLLLLIASVNVANLFMVRTEGRRKELAIRATLGAGSKGIAAQLIAESTALSVIGGALGIALAYGSLQLLPAVRPSNVPRLDDIVIDGQVIVFAIVATAISGLLFTIWPVVRAARSQLSTALNATTRSSSGSVDALRSQNFFIVLQFALALVLVVGAGLMIRTSEKLSDVQSGFSRGDEVQTLRIDIPRLTEPDGVKSVRMQNLILDRIAALPGVETAAYVSGLPLETATTPRDLMIPEGRSFAEGERPETRQYKFTSPRLFEAMGIPLVAGRDLEWDDAFEKRPVVLISESIARAEWGSSTEALGKRIRSSSTADQWREIVGVVGDVRERGPTQPATGVVYLPVIVERLFNTELFVWRGASLVIRSPRAGTSAFVDEIRSAVWSVDPNLPIANVQTLGDIWDVSMARTSFTLVMLVIAGGMALLLGVIGVYGVMAYAATQRTREMGIRIALGAQKKAVCGLFVRHALVLAAVGIAIGGGGALALGKWMSAILFEVDAWDPLTYVASVVALVIAAFFASYVPARRAAAQDPMETLRSE